LVSSDFYRATPYYSAVYMPSSRVSVCLSVMVDLGKGYAA